MPDVDHKQRTAMDEIDRTARTLLEVSRLVNSTLEHDILLNRILESAGKVLPFDSATVLLLKDDSVYVKASVGFAHPENILGLRMPLADYKLDREVIDTGLPIISVDVHRDPRWMQGGPTEQSARIHGWMGVPLSAGGRTIGILSLDSYQADTYQSAHVFVAAAFAAQVAIALENSRLYTETRKRVRELSAINRISVAVTEHLDVDELCSVVGDSVREVFKLDVVFIALLDDDGERISTPYFFFDGERKAYPPIKLGEGLTSLVMSQGKPLLIDHDGERRQTELGAIMRADRVPKTWLGIPLMSGKQAIGVLSAQNFENEYFFSEDEVNLLSTVASIAAAAIQNARLFRETIRREREATAIAEIGRQISSSLDFNTVVQLIVSLAHPLLSKDTTAVYLMDPFRKELAVMAATGKDADALKADTVFTGQGIIGAAAETGKPYIENDIFHVPGTIHISGTADDLEGDKLMAIPLLVDDEVLGVLAVWRGADEPRFRDRDLGFAESMARQATVALKNARLFRAGERAREEAVQANRLKSQFLANMSHELRTPLNSIINFAYLLNQGTEGKLGEGQADLLGRIEDSGRHLLDLINDVLDLAKIEAGRMELFFEEVDLAELVEGVASTAQGLIKDKPIALRIGVPKDMPPLKADRTRLRQVLFNLVSNAVKFTEAGSVTVTAERSGGFATIKVADTGIGIRQEDIPRAFSEFVQLDGGLARRVGGTGLGLPISQRFIEMHGGKLAAESEPGRGSIFSFSIPLSPESPAQVPGDGAETVSAPTRVLVLNDDDDSLAVVKRSLAGAEYSLEFARDGRSGIEAARAREPDVIVADATMRGGDGFDIAESIAREPGLRDIPIVLVAPRESASGERARFRDGRVGFLRKGAFAADELIKAVKAAKAHRRPGGTP